MTKRKRKAHKHFVCRFCDQDTDRPVVGKPRVGRSVMICPGCRGAI